MARLAEQVCGARHALSVLLPPLQLRLPYLLPMRALGCYGTALVYELVSGARAPGVGTFPRFAYKIRLHFRQGAGAPLVSTLKAYAVGLWPGPLLCPHSWRMLWACARRSSPMAWREPTPGLSAW